jgi:hypothetical protein
LHWQHGHAEEAVRIGATIIGQPTIVGAADAGGKLGILHRPRKQAEARIEEGGVDAVEIHIFDALVGVESSLAALYIPHILRDSPLPSANSAEVAEALRPADHLIFHAQALFAIVIDKELGGAVAVFGIHVPLPEINRL